MAVASIGYRIKLKCNVVVSSQARYLYTYVCGRTAAQSVTKYSEKKNKQTNISSWMYYLHGLMGAEWYDIRSSIHRKIFTSGLHVSHDHKFSFSKKQVFNQDLKTSLLDTERICLEIYSTRKQRPSYVQSSLSLFFPQANWGCN